MRTIISLIITVLLSSACTDTENRPPNIIIIFTDDQGYGDLGCYGSETIHTPNIDLLADDGIKFTDFHMAASVCTPSRAALLTGCYPVRVSLPRVLFPDGAWGSRDDIGLNPEEETLAELLKGRGYATGMAGKWHLGHRKVFLPLQHGFDEYLGIPYSNDMNRGNLPLLMGNDTLETEPDQSLLTRRYTEFCTDFIKRKSGGPFFLYLAHTMPHIPIYASSDFLDKSDGGLYGDVLEEIDWSVGEIVRTLNEEKVREKTLLIYTSDNGPWLSYGNHGGSAGGLRGGKFDIFEGGFRVPAIMNWPGVIPEGSLSNAMLTSMDLLPSICFISGADLPVKKFDGINVFPVLEGKDMQELAVRYFYYYSGENLLAVRKGKWKYCRKLKYGVISEPGMDGINGSTEYREQPEALYDLEKDLDESENRIHEFPEIAEELKKAAEAFETKIRTESRPIGIAPGSFQSSD